MKKRLFISSILMTLVLLVAITTATFAWYSAANNGVQKSASGGVTTITSQTNVSLAKQTINVVVAREGSENMALTHATDGTHFESKGLINGQPIVETNPNVVGQYKITVTWANTELTQEQKQALGGNSVEVVLRADGNLKLLLDKSARGGSNNEAVGNVTVTITWVYDADETSAGADGISYGHFTFEAVDSKAETPNTVTLVVASGSNIAFGGFAIEPNNLSGAEFESTSDTGYTDEALHSADGITVDPS